ncbi:SH3 domain-containing protein [Bacillus sp. ISL-35]|uniref:SH3 domain-containing protein n=1 Tax=Bacillus sp. ISL-35 TaxID=2819122 RepID=UPI001BE6D202|nr:SH3 domain-containing protein [Bacillus sp. ISL-35]MBT2678808.1 SH3 domain-containing protein [Bacillus sp. ISL-35]MBT2703800.1 SH3 domain-containing protein [Chryseobacterium sp. ISL-80]
MKNFGKALVLSTGILVGSASVPALPFNILQAEAASVVKLNNSSYQTTSNLNLRSGASTKYKVLYTIPKGKKVTATQRNGNWYKVTYSYTIKGKNTTKTGWVTGSFLKATTSSSKSSSALKSTLSTTVKTPATSYKTTANLNIRSGAGTKYKVIKTISKNSIVSSAERKGSWYKVSYQYTSNRKKITLTGWVSGSYLKEHHLYTTTKKTYYFTIRTSELYKTADTKKKPIQTARSNHGFESTEKVVNSLGQTLYKVKHQRQTVYIPAKNVKSMARQDYETKEYVTTKEAIVYSSYGTGYSNIGRIPENTIITSTVRIGDWFEITYMGKKGFVQASYLTQYVPPVEVEIPEEEKLDTGSTSEEDTEQVLTETAISGKTYVTTSALNLRNEAGTNSSVIGVIPNATFVFPTHKVSNGWYKLTFNGKSGYVHGDFVKDVVTGDPFHRTGYQFIDLRMSSKVTASQIDQYIAGYLKGRQSVLTGKGQAFINAGNKYGINSLYLAAHAIHESGYGASNISLGKLNLFGFGAYDSSPFIAAVRFSSIEQNIDYIAQEMKATYLNPNHWKYKGANLGFSTKTVLSNTRIDANSTGMNFYYASDPKWGQKIAAHMQKIFPYNQADYQNTVKSTAMFPLPSRSEGKDLFPQDIEAIARKDIKLVSQKGSTTLALTLKKDTVFDVVEKHNDYWVKVSLGGKEYWTNDIKFDRYKEFMSVKNLGRVTAASLNVRPTPSIALSPIGSYRLNDYVHIVLDANGNIKMDGTKTWYNVKLPDGRTGWVSSTFVIAELR